MFILLQVLAGQSLPPLPRPLPVLPVPPLSQTPGGNNPNSIDQGEQDINPDIAIIRQRLNGIRQEEVLARRQVLRQGTPMGLFIDGLNRANRPTQFQADGSFRDRISNTDYHYQFDRAFYNSSGQVLRPGTNTWTPVSHGLLNSTRLIGMLDLVPNPNRSYTFVRSNLDGIPQNPAVYFLQPDGNLFRTAGMEDGRNVPAGIFSIAPNGSAQFNQTNTHMPGTDLIYRGSFQQTGTPGVFNHPDGFYVYVLPNGHLLYLRKDKQNDTGDVQISASGTSSSWTGIGRVNPPGGANPGQFTLTGALPTGVTLANIQAGIRAIETARGISVASSSGVPRPTGTSAPPPLGGNNLPAPNPVSTPLATNPTLALTSVRLTPTGTPGVFNHPDGFYVYVLPDRYLLYLRKDKQNNTGDVQISASGTSSSWTGIGQVNSPAVTGNAHIQAGIRAIETARGIPAAPSSAPTPLLTTAQAIERFRVFESQCQLPAINLRVGHANVRDNGFSRSTYYLMCALASRCGATNDTVFHEELIRMTSRRPVDRGMFNRTTPTLNFIRAQCPPLVPADTLDQSERYACLIEELMCGTNGSCETTMITHLPTDTQSFSAYTRVDFSSTRNVPVNNLIHIFTTDGGMNPVQAALINTRLQQFARLSVTDFYQGSNSWNDNYVQEIVRGIVTDLELGLTTERGREAMRRVLQRVFNAFNHGGTWVSTTENYPQFSGDDLRTIAARGRGNR